MTQEQLRTALAIFMLCTHLLVPVVVFIIYLSDGFTRSELEELLKVIIPLVSTLSGLAIAYVIRTRRAPNSRRDRVKLSRLFVGMAITLPLLFVGAILSLSLLKAWNIGLSSFADLKTALATVETIFGTYTGQVITALYEEEKSS